jgi:putative flippase GtrA
LKTEKDDEGRPRGQTVFTREENIRMTLKYILIMISAGVIQIVSFTLLTELNVFGDTGQSYGWSYFVALTLSVIWNFTVNRQYTFRSANNVPKAMFMVFCYYLVFTPLSIWWGIALTEMSDAGWVEYVVLLFTMAVNGITEFLFMRFVVFRDSINTNKAALRMRMETGRNEGT